MEWKGEEDEVVNLGEGIYIDLTAAIAKKDIENGSVGQRNREKTKPRTIPLLLIRRLRPLIFVCKAISSKKKARQWTKRDIGIGGRRAAEESHWYVGTRTTLMMTMH